MKLSELFDSNAFFRSDTEIKEWIRESKNYAGEDPILAEAFMFFSTSKQRTYLVTTKNRLYCILDDSRKDHPHINWSIPKDRVMGEDGLMFSIKAKDKSKKTGLVDIGEKHKNWLYSKELFSSSSIESSMEDFIISSM